MSDLKELKERINAAESGYPQLDLLIWNTLNKRGETWKWLNNVDGDERIICDKMPEGSIFHPVCSVDRFSRSIDSAVELLEAKLPGWHWRIAQGDHAFAIINPPDAQDNSSLIVKLYAKTPALALIAALIDAVEATDFFSRLEHSND